jgi:hypothetical protein
MTVFDYIVLHNLPLSMCKTNDYLIINCHAWDIQEIDDMLSLFQGTRIGFDVKIYMDCIYERATS